MQKEFIPYEQALALKKLGFDEPCFAGYSTSTEKLEYYSRPLVTKDSFTVDAPTYSQAFRWFRKKYKLNSWIESYCDEYFYFKIDEMRHPKTISRDDLRFYIECKTYEEAELACLKKLIEIVKE